MPDPRPSAARRGYDRRWRRAARLFLMEHPVCAIDGQNCTRTATVVDHITPHRGDATLFWDQGNWQSACKPCHDGTKQAMERRGTTEKPRLRGCDENGTPLDPGHWWG